MRILRGKAVRSLQRRGLRPRTPVDLRRLGALSPGPTSVILHCEFFSLHLPAAGTSSFRINQKTLQYFLVIIAEVHLGFRRRKNYAAFRIPQSGAAPRGDWRRTVPLTPHKGHFCKSSKTDEKILGIWRVTSPTTLEFQPELVISGFQRPKLIILSNC